jgi:hypothetical protein
MEDNSVLRRMLKGRIYSARRKGRPTMRWLDNVENDLKMKVKGWIERMRNESSEDRL